MSDLEKVKELRKATGAGFKDCNNALKEASGDLEKSIEILRVKGISKASKKMSRDANEGLVAIYGDEKKISIIEVNCETDFVAKNEDFLSFVSEISELNHNVSSSLENLNLSKMKNGKKVEENIVELVSKIGEKITLGKSKTFSKNNTINYFYLHNVIKDNLAKLGVIVSIKVKNKDKKIEEFCKQLSMHIAALNPLALKPEEIDKNLIDKEKELIREELKETGKPENIITKISEGKLKKFLEDNSLITQDWVMEPKKKVSEIISTYKVHELEVLDFYRIKIGN